jgi:hypothetical protein
MASTYLIAAVLMIVGIILIAAIVFAILYFTNPSDQAIERELETLYPNTSGYTYSTTVGVSPNLIAQVWTSNDTVTTPSGYPGAGGAGSALNLAPIATPSAVTSIPNLTAGSIVLVSQTGVTSWPSGVTVYWDSSGASAPVTGIKFTSMTVEDVTYTTFLVPTQLTAP